MCRSASDPHTTQDAAIWAQQRDVERYRRLAHTTGEGQGMDDQQVSQNRQETLVATEELRAVAIRNVEALVEEARILLEAGQSTKDAFMELTAKVTLRSMVAGQDPASTHLVATLCEAAVRLARSPDPASSG